MLESGTQIAAARALLGWSQKALAGASGYHVNAVKYWEARAVIASEQADDGALAAFVRSFDAEGVCFVKGGAVQDRAA